VAVNGAVNDTVTKVQSLDTRVNGTGAGQLGNTGKIVHGTVLAASFTVGGALVRATQDLILPAGGGSWLVIYNVQVASGAALNVTLRMYGVGGGGYFDHIVQGASPQSRCFTAVAGPGATVSVYGINSGAAVATSFLDNTNHTLYAIGLN
jgi:hypothetical protein